MNANTGDRDVVRISVGVKGNIQKNHIYYTSIC